MKKNILTYIIYSLFVVGTVITLYIVNMNIDNSFSYKFVIGYVIFLALSFLYFTVVTVINIGKLKKSDLRKRLVKFITWFVLLSGLNYIIHYFFVSSEIDYYRLFSIPFAASVGFSFYGLMFSTKKKN
jgi:hypothetical protein